MIKNIKLKFFVSMMLMIFGIGLTKAVWYKSALVDNNSFSTSSSQNTDIALNEFMANPTGADNAPMPGGEWIELYNNGNWAIDVNGWHLYDVIDSHSLPITSANTGGGSTVIPARGYLVVYRSGDSDFSLNNNGDTLRLYDGNIGASVLIDSIIYGSSTENKTWARIPDGTGVWQNDRIATPGSSN